MKYRVFFTFVIFSLFVPQNFNLAKTANPNVIKNDEIVKNVPQKLILQVVSEPKKDSGDLSKNMPWIGAIFIGLTTVVANFLISRAARSSSLTIAKRQMEVAINNSDRDFKKSVISINRQSWINDFRNNISELISMVIVLSSELKFESEDNLKLSHLITKAELMLTDEPEQSNLARLLTQLKTCFTDIMIGNQTVGDLENNIEIVKKQTILVLRQELEKARNAE